MQEDSFGIIPLTQGKFAIVDNDNVAALRKFSWRAVQGQRSYYAKTSFRKDGKHITVAMHRFIARTPFGWVCHHRNGNSLDNRRANLQNMSKEIHDIEHANNRILIKFAVTPTIKLGPTVPTAQRRSTDSSVRTA